MKKSRVLTLGLACFFTAVTAFSAVAATSGGGGALYSHLNDTSAASSPLSQGGPQGTSSGQSGGVLNNSQAGQGAGHNASGAATAQNGANLNDAKAELDANILAGGGLGLDPENDPVIATTDWGLDIKFHADWGSFSTLSSGGLSGYCYFSMGSYNGTPINWVIIGRSNDSPSSIKYVDGTYTNLGTKYQTYNLANYISQTTPNATYYKSSQYENSTPAGTSILNESSKMLIYDYKYIGTTFANAVASSEIPSKCVLCLSEKSIYETVFDEGYSNNYSNSDLKTHMSNLYSSSLGLTSTQKSYIVAQTLTTSYGLYNNQSTTTLSGQYFFPLSGKTGNTYCVTTYLTTDAKRQCNLIGASGYVTYWLRSGSGTSSNASSTSYISNVYEKGYLNFGFASNENGVRPAFVLKI